MRAEAIKKIDTKWLFAKTSLYPRTVLLRVSHPSLNPSITAIGNIDILKQAKLALFCSVKCPGNISLKALDLARALRDSGVTLISGFHSPIERKILKILLPSPSPLIVCPARCLEGMSLPREYKKPLAEGRLLLLSPFEKNRKYPTTETSSLRNEFAAAVADAVFVVHAAPESNTEYLCREIISWRKTIYTMKNNEKNMIKLGARPLER